MRSITLGCFLLLLTAPARAQDWPQWRGPDRNGACVGGPKLIENIPETGLRLVWQSEPIPDNSHPGERGSDVGYSSPVAAGGRVYLYLNQRLKDERPFKLSWGIRNRLGCVEPPLPDALAKKVEAARLSPELTALADDQAPAWANNWLIRNLTHAQHSAFATAISNRLMRRAEAVELAALELVAALKDESFQKVDDLESALEKTGLASKHVRSIVKELKTERLRALDVIFCFDAATGTTIWKNTYSGELFEYGTSSTPCIVGDRIYVSGGKTLYCLKTSDGSEIWQASSPVKEVSSSPLVVDGIVLIQAGSLCALDAKDGKLLWTRPEFKGIHASPTVWAKDGKNYAVQNGGLVDLRTGALLWQIGGGGSDSSPVVAGDRLIMANLGGLTCHRLALDKPAELWKLTGYGISPSTPIIFEEMLYGTVSQSGPLFCVDLATGKVRWTSPEKENYGTTSFNTSSCIIVDGKIFIDGGDPAKLFVVRAQSSQFELLGKSKLAASSLRASTPTIADGRLFVRGKDALLCYDLRK